jgi:hypothetical protein
MNIVRPSCSFSIVFILLALLILFRLRKGKPLTKTEKTVLIVGLIAGIVDLIAGLIYIFSVLMPNYSWSDRIAQIPVQFVILVFSAVFIVSVVTKILLHYRRHIDKSINKHYRKRLVKDVGSELEKEVTIKNIILANQQKDEVLKDLTERVSNDIMEGRLLPTYNVYDVPDKGCMKLGGLIFTISKDSAEILAKKMTELYNNRKYRKRLYRYSSLFI